MTGQEDTDPHGTQRPSHPLGRPGDAWEMAELIVWLAGESSSYVNGASISPTGACR